MKPEQRKCLRTGRPPSDIVALATFLGEGCVSIYLRTTPVTPQSQGDRIELKNLASLAAEQLQAAGTDKRSCAAIAEQLDDLVDDNEFWRFKSDPGQLDNLLYQRPAPAAIKKEWQRLHRLLTARLVEVANLPDSFSWPIEPIGV